jgi:hypothetical protein
MRKRVSRREPERGCAPPTANPVGGGAGQLQLRQDLARKLLAASKCEPERRKPVKLDLRVPARAFGVGEQPVNAGAPIAGVEGQLAH